MIKKTCLALIYLWLKIAKNKAGFLHVSSLYDITMKKVNKRLNSGRLVKVT